MMQPAATGTSASCRLYAILARDGRSAVVFRRGPSRQVRLLRWWLDTDVIEPGQWLKGRLYVRRCDLSPDGELLVYFAAKWETPMATWTAVSRPPYLTALALWPKGDAWGGGGLFLSNSKLGLNHAVIGAPVLSGRTRPWHPLGDEDVEKNFPIEVRPIAGWAGGGEDSPIEDTRIMRDGWSLVSAGERGQYGKDPGYFIKLEQPEIYQRPQPAGERTPILLRRILRAIGMVNGPWNVEDFELCRADGTVLRLIAGCDWADWQATGDLLFAMNGSLYRLPAASAAIAAADPLTGAALVADLAGMKFENVKAPVDSTRWPGAQGSET